MKRATIALALGAVVCGPAAGALATTGPGAPSPPSPSGTTTSGTTTPETSTSQTSTPAQPAHSSATAVRLDDLLAISHTTADAGGDSSSASANAVEVGGKPLIDGATGGDQKGSGTSSGSLADTGPTPLGGLAITPWAASASSDSAGTHSSSDAAIAHVFLIDQKTLDLWLFHSQSYADYTPSQSKSSSSSDGAALNAGDGALTVQLLHSETSSGSTGSSTLASVNGNDIGSSDQANGNCGVDASPVAKIGCLDASGGTGSTGQTTSAADVGNVDVGNGQLTGVVSGADAMGQNAPSTGQKSTTKVKAQRHVRGANATAASNANQPGQLPFTGSNVALLSLYGAALTGLGAAILRVGRRRRVQTR